MFGQKPWIIPFGKCRCFALFKTLFFWSKNLSFFSRISKNNLFWLDFSKKTQIRKIPIFGQKPWIIPLGNVHFFQVFKTYVFWSKIYSFLSRISRNDIFEHNFLENTNEKKLEFWEKPWTNLLGKGRFFGNPQNVTFLV